jgi:hypothetical protein
MPTLTMNRVHQAPIAKEIIGCSTAGTETLQKGGAFSARCLSIFNADLRKNSLGMCRPMMSHLVN